MEEDTGVKAPVTRLRRKLSVEQPEESMSPAPSTPTKRRAARRTAKPELELIEENATSKTPLDKTKKTVTKDLIDAIEEKPITPSRRSARIRSNTSIVSETSMTVSSPRAKRAARRLSQVGSDSEAPITPTRQTRRTRKDSASNIDKVENQAAIIQSNTIPESIAEESELNNRKSITDQKDEKNTSITSRKSPRLMEKRDRKSTSLIENDNNLNTNVEDTHNSKEKIELLPSQTNNENYDQTDNKNKTKANKNDRLSISSLVLLENVNNNSNKIIHSLNKSTSAMENLISKNKRLRTKSYTSETIISSNDPSTLFYSDNESSKKNALNRSSFKLLNKSESNNSLLNKSRKKDKSLTNDSTTIAERLSIYNEKNNSKLQNSTDETNSKANIDNNENIFNKDPSADLEVTVVIENPNSEKLTRNEEDQCVPEMSHIMESSSKRDTFNTSKQNENTTIENIPHKNQINDTCEPMDVDETIPDNLLIEDTDKQEENTSNHSIYKSQRKSSIMLSLNESESQSKSTLILSHLKDTFTSEKNKSPIKLSEKCLSNTSTVLNTTEENIMHKKIKSQNYSTSTPLQQKRNEKEISLNNSNIKSNTNNNSKMTEDNLKDSESESDLTDSDNIKMKPKEEKSLSKKKESLSNNSEESDSESSQKSSEFIDDEAKDAGDDYMSGDSQDEEKRQEAIENEIRDKGETLSSEDDLSNDSDYEKDSFIVSSAEEDNELLEGTEDDLSMSDNELTMSAKSKKKYNERKLKEQKRASREMFESRHQSNVSNNSSVSNTKKLKKLRQISSSSESDIEIKKSSKAKNKQRLDSSHDITMTEDQNLETSRRSKTPSQSICNVSVTEPRTPQNSNTSTVFIDAHNESRESSSKECENLDPLATTLVHNDSSMSSDNERIVQEYDSILEGLNKTSNKLKNKIGDISLNLEIKKNKKGKNPIVDDLNLTQVKSKKYKTQKPNKNNEEKNAANSLHINNDESSSSTESALLHLLFSEESNNCEDSSNKTKDKSDNVENKSDKSSSINQTLPKTPGSDKKKKRQSESSQCESSNNEFNNQSSKTPSSGKKNKKEQHSETSLHEKLDTSYAALNEFSKTPTSSTKKKQRKSESETTSSVDAKYKFFIDTEGTRTQDDKSLSTSEMVVPDNDNDSDSDAPLETSFRKEKNTSSKTEDKALQDTELAHEKSFNESVNKTPDSSKKKKKKNKKNNLQAQTENNESTTDQSRETNIESAKKKNIDVPENNVSISTGNDNVLINKSIQQTPQSGKKNKNKSQLEVEPNDEINNTLVNKSIQKIPQSGKKNKNKSQLEVEPNDEMSNMLVNKSIQKTPQSGKKNKNKSQLEVEPNDEMNNTLVNKSIQKTPQSGKKNKNKSHLEVEPNDEMNAASEVNTSVKSPGSKKKQKKLSEALESENNIFDDKPVINTFGCVEKNSNDPVEVQDIQNKCKTNTEQHQNKKRKRNMSTNISEEGKDSHETEEINASIVNKKKKVKLTHEGNDTESKKNRNKKRKVREDDNDETSSKAFKENSLKKLKVSRLPSSLLEQLDEKPRKQRESPKKKAKLISTSNFTVEEIKRRKNKPSTFLEDSIYLNEEDNESKKNRAKNIKPKVLPFVPTASTSISGYTSNFKVNVLPKDTKFVAQSSNIENFKTDYLYNKKIRRIGTYEFYKKSRNIKLAKF